MCSTFLIGWSLRQFPGLDLDFMHLMTDLSIRFSATVMYIYLQYCI